MCYNSDVTTRGTKVASSESGFRTEFLHRLIDLKYHAFSINDRFVSGIPDVWASGELYHGFVELKMRPMPKRPETPIKLNLSDPQRRFLKDEKEAGGRSAWILCVKGNREWFYYAGTDENVEHVEQNSWVVRRRHGEILDVNTLLNHINTPKSTDQLVLDLVVENN